jgi:hypothetical protein
MAYPAPGHGSQVNFFSTPDIFLKQTRTALGTARSNNRRVLLLNRFRVAAIGDESSNACYVAREADYDESEEEEEEYDEYSYVEE